jgi:iron complex outermembrane receptor protein
MGDRFTYDLSASAGRSRIELYARRDAQRVARAASPTSFYLGRLRQREFNLNADFVYRLPVGTGEPANIAFGAERRVETYKVSPATPLPMPSARAPRPGLRPTANGFPGFNPTRRASGARPAMPAISTSNGSRSKC